MIYERFRGVIARVGRVFYDSAETDFHASAFILHCNALVRILNNIL